MVWPFYFFKVLPGEYPPEVPALKCQLADVSVSISDYLMSSHILHKARPMVQTIGKKLTVEEFFALPKGMAVMNSLMEKRFLKCPPNDSTPERKKPC